MKRKNTYRLVQNCLSIFFVIFLLVPASATSQNSIRWYPYKEGLTLGKSGQKKIFLNFYADWCSYCKKMEKETFADRSIINYLNEHFIPIKVNSDKEKETASLYQVEGLPTTFFISEKGENIGYRPGYVPPEDMLTLLKYVKSDSYRTMTIEKFAGLKDGVK